MLSTQKIQTLKAHIAQLKPTWGGKFFFYCLPFRKKVVLKNLQQVFANALSAAEIHRLALSFYSHVFASLKENIQLRFMSQENIRKRAIVIGEEYLADLEKNTIKGALVMTGHFGNWEFAPIAGILNFKKFKQHFYFVRKTQANKWLEKILFKRYYEAGLGVIPKKNSLSKVSEILEKNQVVVMVMDQYAKGKEGIAVEFFGKKTATYRTVAMLACQTGVPVIPARSYRRSDGYHVLEFFPPLIWQSCENAREEIYVNTRHYNEVLENLILDYPEQWLWMYKRWKDR